jgi:hypothetical protein
MTEWWYGIVILVLAVLVGLFLIDRQRRSRGGQGQAGVPATGRNYVNERDDARHAGMSAEDRTWEVASQNRHQENQARRQTDAATVSGDRTPDVV